MKEITVTIKGVTGSGKGVVENAIKKTNGFRVISVFRTSGSTTIKLERGGK